MVVMKKNILVLYYSAYGHTAQLANHIAAGVNGVSGAQSLLRTVPPVDDHISSEPKEAVPKEGPPFATMDELAHCDGLILGSPTRFGNMAAPLKYFLDNTSGLWMNGALIDKPAAVFTSSETFHGGQESTLLSMMIPLLHHGMIIVGLPYSIPALNSTRSGGTPYGASHVIQAQSGTLSKEEIELAKALGERVALLSQKWD